jgi:metal-dependent HD superfamily phosphatase/phosphodiesterase
MKSLKETAMDSKLLNYVQGDAKKLLEILLEDKEIHAMQEYANIVSIRRLAFNDHGPVHMRKVTLNALCMLELLEKSGIKSSLQNDEAGTLEDSRIAVILSAFLHDVGMTIGRQNHELNSALISLPVISRVLAALYPDDEHKRMTIQCLALEGIEGHMGTQHIHSVEAGIILVADGCDMEKGRSRIPLLLGTAPHIGSIHQFSSSAISSVQIGEGVHRPIRISILMDESVGFFQVEEVLLHKINMSPIKPHIELFAAVEGQEAKKYLG